MPTIRIDDDVYSWLRVLAIPFEDTPNSVLRRLAGLDKTNTDAAHGVEEKEVDKITMVNIKHRQITGKRLNELWHVGAVHALYHQEGTFYENLRAFPGVLFDYNGYVVFKTQHDYNTCRYLDIQQKLNVHQGISSIPGYKRMR